MKLTKYARGKKMLKWSGTAKDLRALLKLQRKALKSKK
jgi:hypothetical protein